MARPPKPREKQSNTTIKFRVTDAEKTSIEQMAFAEHCDVTKLIKLRVLGAMPKRRKATSERSILIKELGDLGRIGTNINQIAKALNSGAGYTIPDGEISAALYAITEISNRILTALENGNQG
jgi:hypothetical protein